MSKLVPQHWVQDWQTGSPHSDDNYDKRPCIIAVAHQVCGGKHEHTLLEHVPALLSAMCGGNGSEHPVP